MLFDLDIRMVAHLLNQVKLISVKVYGVQFRTSILKMMNL